MSHQSNACPTFFRANIANAVNSHVGYAEAGFHLALQVRELVESDVDDSVLEAFERAVADEDENAILVWLDSALPRCMALVPSRRRCSFMRGVMRAVEEDRA